jgi:hypothetical protein
MFMVLGMERSQFILNLLFILSVLPATHQGAAGVESELFAVFINCCSLCLVWF